jgi:guanylate kinase
MKGKAIIFSAPSGSGKTTIVRHLLEQDLNLEFSVSACSRAPRENETDGKDYYFLSVKEFKEGIAKGDFLEWEEVYEDHYYGTLNREMDRIWNAGRHVVFDVDVAGGVNLKEIFKDNALAIFIQPPDLEVLEERLRNRSTDPEDKIRKRIAKASDEMEYASRFDVVLVNDILEDTLNKAEELVSGFLKSGNRF